MGVAHRAWEGQVREALEDQGADPLRQEGRYPIDYRGRHVGGQESGSEGGGIDVVEATFDVQEECASFSIRSLEGHYLRS